MKTTKTPRLPNFTPFGFTASRFRVTGQFETSALNDPKTTLNTKTSKVPHIHLTTTPTPKFHSISLHGQPILSYRPHWDNAPNDPKMALNTKRSKVPHIHSRTTPDSQFSLFRSTASRFRVAGHFETSEPNNPQMTLNTERSKVSHIHIPPNS